MAAVPTHGRVVLETTVGDIEIELWSKEAPKACRNFLALSMEGYYDGVIFHRVVPDFLVQTGDRTGTGGGGESFFGEPFADEIHPRLRFTHRGLVACANNGEKNTNDSQFFITLDRADELHGKHTLWGRCVGDTFFNALKIGQMELDDKERPLYPPKIKSVKILENPFDDIVPRITAEEKRAQQKAREEAQREREEAARRKSAKKNVGLLSFGMDGGTIEDEEPVTFKKKSIARPDLMEDVEQTSSMMIDVAVPTPPTTESSKSKSMKVPTKEPKEEKTSKASSSSKKEDIGTIREKHAKEKDSEKTALQKDIEKMEADIKKLNRRRGDPESSDEDEQSRMAKKAKGPSILQQELAKYTSKSNKLGGGRKGKGKKNEDDILSALSSFRSKIKDAMDEDVDEAPDKANEEDEGVEVDDDKAWLNHSLHFPKDDNAEEVEKAQEHYEVIDPRARGEKARQEQREQKGKRRDPISKVFQRSQGSRR